MNSTKLKALVKEKIMALVGKPNTKETQAEVEKVVTDLIKRYPMQTHVISQALQEGETEWRNKKSNTKTN